MNTRIAMVRKAVNKSQAQFAEAIGLSRNFISMLETGDRIPSDRTITDICREFNVNEMWLREGEGEMFLPQDKAADLDRFLDEIKNDPDGSIRKEFISALAKMGPEFWDQWAAFMQELAK